MIAYRSDLYNLIVKYLHPLTFDNISMDGNLYLLNNQIENLKNGKYNDLQPPFWLIYIDTGEGNSISVRGATKFDNATLELHYVCQPKRFLTVSEEIQIIKNSEILSQIMASFSWGDVENASPLNLIEFSHDREYKEFYHFVYKYKFNFEDYQNVLLKQDLEPGV